MGVISEICMTIDLINSENKNNTKLFYKFRAKNRIKRLKKILNTFFKKNSVNLNIMMDFIYNYTNTINIIKFDNLDIINNEDTEDIKLIYYPLKDNKNILVSFYYNYFDSLNLCKIGVNDLTENKDKILVYHIVDKYFKPNDSKECEFILESFKSMMINYLYERIHIGEEQNE